MENLALKVKVLPSTAEARVASAPELSMTTAKPKTTRILNALVENMAEYWCEKMGRT